MIRVLIAGANSYIGIKAAETLSAEPERFEVRTLDLRGEWDESSFAGFDAVVHVAGIAHQRETAENAPQYFSVNRDLALAVGRAAKARGVKQFLFLSSMSVYGLTCGRITEHTPVCPTTHYGKSKWEAEQGLRSLEDIGFQVAIIRPPMVYGPDCKGNYPRLAQLVRKLPAFPKVKNERSMLYIDTLCAFIRRLLESGERGLFFPQNRDYVTTNELARQIALAHHKRLWQPRGLGWLLSPLCAHMGLIGKVFGTLTYDLSMSAAFADEPQPSFDETIRQTEASV